MQNASLANLITNEDKEVLHELQRLIPIVKNRWFAMGRDMNKLSQLMDAFGRPKETTIQSFTSSGVSGNTLVRVRQTIIKTG